MVEYLCEEEKNIIIKCIEKYVYDWNSKNIDIFSNHFDQDAEFTDVRDQVAKGVNNIKKQHEYPFNNTMKYAILSMDNIKMRKIDQNIIICTAKWITIKNKDPYGKDVDDRNGVMQIIYKKYNDKYKIALVHNTDLTNTYKKYNLELKNFMD